MVVTARRAGLTLAAVALVLGWEADHRLAAGSLPEPLDAVVVRAVPAPDGIHDLTFAEGHLWSIDTKKSALLEIDPTSGNIVATRPFDVKKARGLTWDGRSFWCGRDDGRFLDQVEKSSGKVVRSLDRRPTSAPPGYEPSSQVPYSPYSMQALAWDGKGLWGAFERGLVGSVVRIDPSHGRTVNAMPAQAMPLGLASDGKSLWMATYDTGRGRALLVRWTIPQVNEVVSVPLQGVERTRTVVARLPGKEPAGLAWDGSALWYADRKQRQIMQLQLPSEQ
jgi:hypothetical protein